MKGGSTKKKMSKMNKRSKRSKRVMRGGGLSETFRMIPKWVKISLYFVLSVMIVMIGKYSSKDVTDKEPDKKTDQETDTEEMLEFKITLTGSPREMNPIHVISVKNSGTCLDIGNAAKVVLKVNPEWGITVFDDKGVIVDNEDPVKSIPIKYRKGGSSSLRIGLIPTDIKVSESDSESDSSSDPPSPPPR